MRVFGTMTSDRRTGMAAGLTVLVAVFLAGVLAGLLGALLNQMILVFALASIIIGGASGIYAGMHVRRSRRGQSGQVRRPHR